MKSTSESLELLRQTAPAGANEGCKFARRILLSFLFLWTALFAAIPTPAQSEMDQMFQRIGARLQAYSAKPDLSELGYMAGLWKDNGDSGNSHGNLRSIIHLGDVAIVSIVNPGTGDLVPIGFVEQANGVWKGWFSLRCRGCCPDTGWWDRGTLTPQPGVGVFVESNTKKMDPGTCKLTNEPDTIAFTLQRTQTLRFKEIAPGKIIYMIGAPAVGSQQAQFKAAVTLQWDLQSLGVSYFTLVATGRHVFDKSTNLQGEYQFVTDHSGNNTFVLAAFNKNGQPLHFEIISVDIPGIPGIGR